MSKKMKSNWVPTMLRLEPEDDQNLADEAHAAQLPKAVYARELVLNRIPKAAPPPVSQLPFDAGELLAICHRCVSNLSQLETHALEAGEPLSRLAGPSGVLFKLRSEARKIGLQIKAGQMLDSQKIAEFLARLEGPARSLNEQLALPLNQGKTPTLEAWRSVLESLQIAFFGGTKEVVSE